METILDWKHDTRSIPERGLAVERSATTEERVAVKEALDVVACSRLVARYEIVPEHDGRIRLTGTADATVTQTCIVSLEDFERPYSAPIDVEFWPSDALTEESDTVVDPLGPDREPIEDGRIDAGRIVYEELASVIDPFPRRDGAALDWKDEAGAAATHPFAALGKLRRKES
jgi:uncharacterized metal-binding protein YceD (DUF177 family)